MRFTTSAFFTPGAIALAALTATATYAAPSVSRLTPPSELFTSGQAAPVIARFLPGHKINCISDSH